MSAQTIYLLDANVFIQAARKYYAFDLAPKFWESLIQLSQSGRLKSIDRVKTELERGNDDLATWASSHFDSGFFSTNEQDILRQYASIMAWVQAQTQFESYAKSEFAAVADGWLVAYASVKNCTLVTHETLDPNVRKRVKIPNVCAQFNVPFIDTFEMLRALGVRFN